MRRGSFNRKTGETTPRTASKTHWSSKAPGVHHKQPRRVAWPKATTT